MVVEDLLGRTFALDSGLRNDAIEQLALLQDQSGFLESLFHIAVSGTNDSIAQAAALYIKNTWVKNKKYTTSSAHEQILKSSILGALVNALENPQKGPFRQLFAILRSLVDDASADYFASWPVLIHDSLLLTQNGIASGNPESPELEAGLFVLVTILKSIRFRASIHEQDAKKLAKIIDPILAYILPIMQSVTALLRSQDSLRDRFGRLSYLCLKAYRHSIHSTLTKAHRNTADSWMPIFRDVCLYPDTSQDWQLAKKWALHALSHIFSEYGNPLNFTPGSRKEKKYKPFAESFVSTYAPPLTEMCLTLLNQGTLCVRSQSLIVHVLIDALRPRSTWTVFRPYFAPFILQYAVSVLNFNEDEIYAFHNDPEEFCRFFFVESDTQDPRRVLRDALTDYLAKAVRWRQKHMIPVLIDLCSGPLDALTLGRLLVFNASIQITSVIEYRDPFLNYIYASVLPLLASPLGIQRLVAGRIITSLLETDYDWPNINELMFDEAYPQPQDAVFTPLLSLLVDSNLAIKVQAALALPSLVVQPTMRQPIAQNVGRIMQELLSLTVQIDLDALASSMYAVVTEFPDDIAPFALQLCNELMLSYDQIASDISETGASDNVEEKLLTLTDLVHTVSQLVSCAPQAVHEIQSLCLPRVSVTLSARFYDVFSPVFYLLYTLMTVECFVSDELWPIWDMLCSTAATDDAADYFPDMEMVLTAFIDISDVSQLRLHLSSYFHLYEFLMLGMSEPLPPDERSVACSLMARILTKTNVNVEPIFEMTLSVLSQFAPLSPSISVARTLQVLLVYFVSSVSKLAILFDNPALLPLWSMNIMATSLFDCELNLHAFSSAVRFALSSTSNDSFLVPVLVHLVKICLVSFKAVPVAAEADSEDVEPVDETHLSQTLQTVLDGDFSNVCRSELETLPNAMSAAREALLLVKQSASWQSVLQSVIREPTSI